MKLPNFKNSWNYENNFLLSCNNFRIAKILAHYELFKIASEKQGHFVLGGVFRGISTVEFATFVELFEKSTDRKIIIFDEFGKFPKNNSDLKSKLIIQQMGSTAISISQLLSILKHKKINNVELIKGKIPTIILDYVKSHPKLKISLLNLDIDIYDRNLTALFLLYPFIVKGGILILNDYGIFQHETKIIDNYFKNKNVEIKKFPFSKTPSYIIKK
jgi:hypothetical protein|tara:strand:- start:6665 stop:7312 length:648 start_codon:yes stop_codon:yes gene_type:complete